MTTTEYLASVPAVKQLVWMHNVLSHVKFRPEYANATIEVKFERVKGEKLDTFVTFTLADGTVTRLSSGKGQGDLNGVQTKWPEARKAFLALAALAKEEKKEEASVAEAAAPAKPKAKAARKAKASKTVPAEEVAPEVVQAAIEKVFEDAKDVPFMPDPEDVSDLDA